MRASILEYLSSQNPEIDDAEALEGTPTEFRSSTRVTGMRVWSDFTYKTLISIYGDVLGEATLPEAPQTDPPLTTLEARIFDEDSLEHFLSRTIVPAVNYALKYGWKKLYSETNANPEMSRGGRAKKMAQEDKRWYPDWAGAHNSMRTEIGLRNICPGDTKLSTKWSMHKALTQKGPFLFPVLQVQSYCGESWNVRYGYLITQEELVVFRITRQTIDPGIALTRSKRDAASSQVESAHQQQIHRRLESTSSAGTHMSIDRTSSHSREVSMGSISGPSASYTTESYTPDERTMEFKPIEYRSIPWDNSGMGKLTIKLALWWLHMMAAAPECNVSVQTEYPPLDSWVAFKGHYRHSSTGKTTDRLSRGAFLYSSSEPLGEPSS